MQIEEVDNLFSGNEQRSFDGSGGPEKTTLFFRKQKENEQLNHFEIKKMAEYLNMIKNTLAKFETQHPDPERFAKVLKAVNDAIAC
ncbi:hypothetical protein MXB_1707 [Myxobolus squamalis]|nr:hypothetical protein MXB_1707 [Myxobolus squamalis]